MKEILSALMLQIRKGIYIGDKKYIDLQKNEKDVSIFTYNYMNDNETLHQLNLYIAKDNHKLSPLIIDIHGGGWVYGDKDTNGLLCMDFAKRGFIVMSMSYRLLPENKLIDMVQDIFASIHYLYSLNTPCQIDYSKVVIMGDSAGGHLNLLLNAINNNINMQEYFNVKPIPFDVKCLILNHPAPYIHNPVKDPHYEKPYRILCYGSDYKSNPIFLNASARNFAKYLDRSKEILIISSREDNVVGTQAFQLKKQLSKLKILYDFYYETGTNCPHVYNVTKPFQENSKKCNNYIEAFIRKNIQ